MGQIIAKPDTRAERTWRDRSIIVCDSNLFSRRLTVDMLRHAGASRIAAHETESAALWAIRQSSDPILVVDGHDGRHLQLIRQLRRSPGHARRTPTVLIGTDVKAPDVHQARDMGVDAIAARPLAPQTLFERLDEICANPKDFIDTPRFSGPDRRAGRPAKGSFKRQADVDAGHVSPLQAAINEARAVIFERLRMNDPLAARVGRSLERFLKVQDDLTDMSREIVGLHRATLGKLTDEADSQPETRMEIVAGLERLVARRAA